MIRKVVCEESVVKEYLGALSTEAVALDTETTDLRYDRLKLTGVSLCDGVYNLYIPIGLEGDDAAKLSLLRDYLSSVERVVAHNWVFDAKVLYKYGIDLTGKKRFDTMVAHHLIDENDRHGLKHLVRTILDKDVEEYDDKLSHYDQKFYNYALDDSLNTWLLYEYFLPLLHKEGVAKLFFNIEMPFQDVLLEMEIEGVLIDQPLLKKQQKVLEQEIVRLESQLYDLLDEPYQIQLSLTGETSTVTGKINFNSSQQLGDILFKRLGLEVLEHTDGGQPKTGVSTINKYRSHPFVAALEKYKIAKKLYDAFVSPDGQIQTNLQADGRVRPNFKDVGTKTGRLACSQPNLQQLPKPKEYAPVNVRELFIAPKGYKMFSVDYSGQEVAVAAQQSKDPTLVKSLNNGYDMHLAIANQFYNLGIPEVALSKKHPDYDSYKEKHSKARTQAKTITFGLMYGKGAYGFSKDFGITEDEAQKIVDDYFAGMPKLKEAIDKAHKTLESSGYVVNLAGRKRHFYKNEQGYYPGFAYRQSFNFLIQGFSADMIRAAMVTVKKNKVKYPEWGLVTIMTVHDEAVYIVKEEYVELATRFVKKCFENVCKKFIVPVKADVEVGMNYGDSK